MSSATGHGEYFIRSVVAHEISARMRHAGESLEEAAVGVVMGLLVERGGDGGVIAVDREGNIAMPFNSTGMYRGYVKFEHDNPYWRKLSRAWNEQLRLALDRLPRFDWE